MTMRMRAMRASVLAVVLGGMAAPGPAGTDGQQKPPSAWSRERGEAIFFGREPLIGRLEGDNAVIPAELSRCANCHGSSTKGQAGLRLDRSTLLGLKKRRGGPPSAYTRDAFCRLVGTGVDPAFVIAAREMPRYALDEAQCSSLWTYLTDGSESHAR